MSYQTREQAIAEMAAQAVASGAIRTRMQDVEQEGARGLPETREQVRASFTAITSCHEAKGREALAMALAQSMVTPDQAKEILAAAPLMLPPDADTAAKIMSSPHAKDLGQMARILSVEPSMTLERAEKIMSIAASMSSNHSDDSGSAFCRFMEAESPETVGVDGSESDMSSEAAGLAQALRQL